jgi:hypothetical protein
MRGFSFLYLPVPTKKHPVLLCQHRAAKGT